MEGIWELCSELVGTAWLCLGVSVSLYIDSESTAVCSGTARRGDRRMPTNCGLLCEITEFLTVS